MLTTKKITILGLFLCVSGYTVWIASIETYQLAKPGESYSLANKNNISQKYFKNDKFISLVNKMQKQLSTQQDQLKNQQDAINRLFATLKDKQIFLPQQLNGVDSTNSNVETDEERVTKQIETLNTAFFNEPFDEKWSNLATDKVSEVFNQVMPESVDVSQLDCQSTFCKISLEHLAEAELDDFLDNFMFKLGWKTSSFIQTTDNEDGSKATIVYLSRDEYSLP